MEFESKIKRIKHLNDEVAVYILEKPQAFTFLPGQFAMLSFKKGEKAHAFSIASSPDEAFLLFTVRKHGEFTSKLQTYNVGASLHVNGPFGTYTLNRAPTKDIIFIAGGVGITPFVSMAKFSLDHKQEYSFNLFYSTRNEQSIALKEILTELARAPDYFKLHYVFTRTAPANWTGLTGRLNVKSLQDTLGSLDGKSFFLCGPAKMIEDLKQQLLDSKVPTTHILIEAWGTT